MTYHHSGHVIYCHVLSSQSLSLPPLSSTSISHMWLHRCCLALTPLPSLSLITITITFSHFYHRHRHHQAAWWLYGKCLTLSSSTQKMRTYASDSYGTIKSFLFYNLPVLIHPYCLYTCFYLTQNLILHATYCPPHLTFVPYFFFCKLDTELCLIFPVWWRRTWVL